MERNETTNWSTPSKTYLGGLNYLRNALSNNNNAVLIREWNEKCKYPILEVNDKLTVENYTFSYGTLSTRKKILESNNLTDFEKELSLNYKTFYGTKKAVETYQKTGYLSNDNFKGMGVSHIIKVADAVAFMKKGKKFDSDFIKLFEDQYINLKTADERHFYDFFKLKAVNYRVPKKFKRKVWVVSILDNSKEPVKIPFMIKIMKVLYYPLKYIPKKSVLNMKDYKIITFRVGGVTHGYSVNFHTPKKFSF